MIVRRATPGDAERLAAVVRRAITVTGTSVYDADQIAVWSASFTAETFERCIAAESVFVVEDGDDIAGVASLVERDDGQAEVDLLYVDPSFAGRGAARGALDVVEAEARDRGITRLWADASLLAAPVFEHLGYEVVTRYVKERGGVSFPNTWLVKQLD